MNDLFSVHFLLGSITQRSHLVNEILENLNLLLELRVATLHNILLFLSLRKFGLLRNYPFLVFCSLFGTCNELLLHFLDAVFLLCH